MNYLTVQQFADAIGMSRQNLYANYLETKIKAIHLGHQWVIPASELRKWKRTKKETWKFKKVK